MLYHLFAPLERVVPGFRLFQYVTFRAAFAAILAFLVATIVGPGIVRSLAARKIAGTVLVGQQHVDEERRRKAAVPTMGGVILLVGVGLSGFLFARLDNPYTWAVLVSFLAFGALGAGDDWKKLTQPKSKGLSERAKLVGQLGISTVVIGLLYAAGNVEDGTPWLRGMSLKASPYPTTWVKEHRVEPGEDFGSMAGKYLGDATRAREVAALNGFVGRDGTLVAPVPGTLVRLPARWPDPADHHRADLQVPFVKSFCLDLGLFLIPFAILVIVGASNAVNLTDGLDGLAIGCTATVAATLTVVAYLVGRVDFSRDLHLFYVPEAAELAVVGAALFGGALGFLWFNGYPATVFMGDTGSLAIGGILGVFAVAIRHELTLLIAGGLFVAEALSVIWQRSWFKWTRRVARRRGDPDATGRRWFRCAPVHHHFQQGGLHENKVTVRFWIVSVICALAALAVLKVR
ncbi:MAG: phospho-N-acetylmuramoyl-pentapeptide-transferase [Planctomycetes bacterium]|nr:phospho-N-acetylmuramoyl-pentapeptide-transferase [Planctomycetota bacterium]